MTENEKNDDFNSVAADAKYLKLLEAKGYRLFNPKTNSQEENVLDGLRHLIKVFLGPETLNIDIKVKIYLIDNAMINTKGTPTISDLVRSMKVMKVPMEEIIDTLKMIKEMGAIDVDIEIRG